MALLEEVTVLAGAFVATPSRAPNSARLVKAAYAEGSAVGSLGRREIEADLVTYDDESGRLPNVIVGSNDQPAVGILTAFRLADITTAAVRLDTVKVAAARRILSPERATETVVLPHQIVARGATAQIHHHRPTGVLR